MSKAVLLLKPTVMNLPIFMASKAGVDRVNSAVALGNLVNGGRIMSAKY